MKKLTLAVIAAFINLFGAFAQEESSYKERKLSLEEVNFVSSYYNQDGNNAAVTGGIGSEQLTDFANQIDLKLLKTDKKNREHNINFSVGIDNYSSASSDKIDPTTISSASAGDTRVYPKLGWTVNNPETGWRYGAMGSFSMEYDYTSIGFGVNAAKTSQDKNSELALSLQAYFDTWKEILPIELRPPGVEDDDAYTLAPRNSFSGSLSFSRVVTKRLQFSLIADGIYQQGLLATRFQRVYFTDGTVQAENLPGTRFKYPVGARLNYFIGSRMILRSYYRFYKDNWGLTAHTLSFELPVKLSPYLTISPGYRYNNQYGLQYFAPYGQHAPGTEFFTSDFDLSDFDSHFIGGRIKLQPEHGVFGITYLAAMELRYGHYIRSTGLRSNIITLGLKFK